MFSLTVKFGFQKFPLIPTKINPQPKQWELQEPVVLLQTQQQAVATIAASCRPRKTHVFVKLLKRFLSQVINRSPVGSTPELSQ